jgi:hypothetical protein
MRTNLEDFLAQFLVGREGGDIYIEYAYRGLEKIFTAGWFCLPEIFGRSPRIHAGEGALQRSGKNLDF